ncbi:hypothetical protein lerEdw1_010947, partial [Lerista edwardsae]
MLPKFLVNEVSASSRYEEKEMFENPVVFPPELTCRIREFCDLTPLLDSVMKQIQDGVWQSCCSSPEVNGSASVVPAAWGSEWARYENDAFQKLVAFPPELKCRIRAFYNRKPLLEGVVNQFKELTTPPVRAGPGPRMERRQQDQTCSKLNILKAERDKILTYKADAEKESQDLLDIKRTLERSVQKEAFQNPVPFPPELTCRIGEFRDVNPLLKGVMKQFQ